MTPTHKFLYSDRFYIPDKPTKLFYLIGEKPTIFMTKIVHLVIRWKVDGENYKVKNVRLNMIGGRL